jgi:glycosyltransferase involved in cell wall biosynthesis
MVRRAVAAILNQDYPGSIECLVVFDQCDPEEIDLPIQSTRSLRLLRNAERNPGLAGARNTGILAATGNLIGFCDDDDEWIQGKLAAQVEFLQRNPEANLVGCGIVLRRDGVDIAKDLSSSVVTFDDLLRSRVWELNPCTLLARLDVVREKIGLADEAIPGSYGEDYDWLLRAARLGPIPMIDKPLVRINWHSGSFFQRRWLTIVEALSYLLDKHPEIKGDKPGLARIQGQIAFAYAGYGDRDAALRTALECLRNDWHELRGYLALAVAVHLVSADRVLKTANARGRGI